MVILCKFGNEGEGKLKDLGRDLLVHGVGIISILAVMSSFEDIIKFGTFDLVLYILHR